MLTGGSIRLKGLLLHISRGIKACERKLQKRKKQCLLTWIHQQVRNSLGMLPTSRAAGRRWFYVRGIKAYYKIFKKYAHLF
jgi:hypothetical protein